MEQEQGNPTPEDQTTTTDTGVGVADANGADSSVVAPPSDLRHTDKDVDKYKGAARKEGRQVGKQEAESELLKRFEATSLDELETLITAGRVIEEESQTETEAERKKREKVEADNTRLSDELEGAYAKVAEMAQDAALRVALVEAGVRPDRFKQALRLADMDSLDVDGDGKVAGASEAVEQVKQDSPEYFGQRETLPETPEGSTKRKSAAQSFMDRKYGTKQ